MRSSGWRGSDDMGGRPSTFGGASHVRPGRGFRSGLAGPGRVASSVGSRCSPCPRRSTTSSDPATQCYLALLRTPPPDPDSVSPSFEELAGNQRFVRAPWSARRRRRSLPSLDLTRLPFHASTHSSRRLAACSETTHSSSSLMHAGRPVRSARATSPSLFA
jgi:hypothetical protein